MAAAITGVASTGRVGKAIVPAGTGFANTTGFTATVTGPNTANSDVEVAGTSSGGGAITPGLHYTPNGPGKLTVTMVCGSDTVVAHCDIWSN